MKLAGDRRIGELSRETGVKVTTIRYYERVGLLDEPPRSESGQRLYDDSAVETLTFIRHARELGFPMEAIRDLMGLQTTPEHNCAAADRIARRQLVDVQKRLSQLKTLEAELKRMIASCEGGKVGNCAVMSSLNDHGKCINHAHERLRPM